MLGRRGPAQAAFTSPEAKELLELEGCVTYVLPEEAELDPLSQKLLADADRGTVRKVELIKQMAANKPGGKAKCLVIRFLVSPTELISDEAGKVKAMTLVHNELYATDAGTLRPRATDQYETIPVGLVFRSIGYRGVPLPGVPFNDNWGVILNEGGCVLDPETKEPRIGEYTSGWIKRGPTGVIGTNKPDSVETVEHMLADLKEGRVLEPDHPTAEAIEQLIAKRQPRYVTYADWQRLDEFETKQGEEQGRPRIKYTSVEKMLHALGK
jgi:ferredoxin--NADP+ reductase